MDGFRVVSLLPNATGASNAIIAVDISKNCKEVVEIIMQRIVTKFCRQGVTHSKSAVRSMGSVPARTIPTDQEQAFGRRRLEVDAEAKGEEYFNDQPVIPPVNAGTRENPIMVPSAFDERPIGFEDPATHQMVWFNLYDGATFFVPTIGLHFKLYYPEDGKLK